MKKAQFVKYLQGFIILSPLPFGCVGRFYMPLFYLLLLVPVLLILAGQGKSLKPLNSGTLLQEKQIRFLFYGFVLFLALQVIPLPMGLLKILSPAAVTTLEQTKTTIPTFYSLSQVPVDTLEFGFRFLAVSLLFVTIISLRLSKWHIFTLLNTLILSASLQAAFGLIKFVTGTNKFFLFFHEREVYSDRLSGTLGNVDHFAFYLEMILPLALCLLFMKMKYFESRRSIRARFIAAMNADRWVLVYSGAVILLGAAIILTGSRGGIIALVLSFLVFAQLTLYLKRTRAIRKKLKWIFLAVALVATFVGIQGTMNRFMETRIESGGRFLRWPNTVTMVKDFPVFGSGFGTYRYGFYLYDTDQSGKWSTHAHNDYLEIMAEGGLIGALLLLLLLGFLYVAIMRMWLVRRHPEMRMVGIGILSALFAVIVHSFFDFSLRIPANILVFVLLLGLGIAAMTYKRDFERVDGPDEGDQGSDRRLK